MPSTHDSSSNSIVSGTRGGGLVLLGSGTSFFLQMVSMLVLSRLLNAADFGLVAMVAIFVALGNLLRDFGLPLAGLQAKILTRQQSSNLFWLSVAVASIFAGTLAASTSALVQLFSDDRLTRIVPALAVGILLGGISAQLQVLLAREGRFASLVSSDVLGQLLGLGVAITIAIAGGGYWALVSQTLTATSLTLTLRWISCRWVPLRFRRGHGSKMLLKTGITYAIAHLLTFAQNNLGSFIIGSQLGAVQLGYYNRAYQLLTAPAGRLLDPLTQVVITTVNRAKIAERDVAALLLRVQFGVGTFIVWLFAITAGTAHGLVPLALGHHWEPAIPIFQVLALGGMVWVMNHVSYWVFIAEELPQALLKYNLVTKPLAVISIIIGSHGGVVGVAWGYTASLLISWPINLIWLNRTAHFPSRMFLNNGLRILVGGLLATGSAGVVSHFMSDATPILGVVAGVVAGSGIMMLWTLALRTSRTLTTEWLNLVKASLSFRTKDGSQNA